nr:BPK_HP1_G0044010.mRNA.1.CDS.1 [Saccharomyces cerevisiae]
MNCQVVFLKIAEKKLLKTKLTASFQLPFYLLMNRIRKLNYPFVLLLQKLVRSNHEDLKQGKIMQKVLLRI